ncbi:MAG TPA: hypothetical protein VJ787_01785, partial [Thermoleophilia bacterium]|nr:hypothetical protein [Thermoleophilia bacterium]
AAAWPATCVVAVEADEARAAGLRANLARQRLEEVRVVVADVLDLSPEFDGRFSAVLLDPPCTGLGTLASRPDLRWRHRPGDVKRLADLQHRLLERAAGLVEPGGALTYSVCTITNAETLGVIDPFLARGGWTLDDLSAAYPRFAHPRRGGPLLTLPSRDHTSGFFIARLRRGRGVEGGAGQSGAAAVGDRGAGETSPPSLDVPRPRRRRPRDRARGKEPDRVGENR